MEAVGPSAKDGTVVDRTSNTRFPYGWYELVWSRTVLVVNASDRSGGHLGIEFVIDSNRTALEFMKRCSRCTMVKSWRERGGSAHVHEEEGEREVKMHGLIVGECVMAATQTFMRRQFNS